ncbi:zf-DNL-domain-containing protein [Coniochaeta sp. PMI_546]|nr:zf-DNL-domain-containing protein [Coniochaeta sp. PMI_546]
MASRRPVFLVDKCLKMQATCQPQQFYRPQLLSRRIIPSNISTTQSPFLTLIRQKHTIPRPLRTPKSPLPAATKPSSGPPSKDTTQTQPPTTEATKSPPPQYELTFTCIPCDTRSKHKVSKQGYHHGSVLIACPSCKNRHVISDHLKIFGDRKITIEDLMRERGQLVKRGTLGEDGDIEFWDDGTSTPREKEAAAETVEAAGESWREHAPGTSFKK